MPVGQVNVICGARDLSCFADFVEHAKHDHHALGTVLLVKSPDGFDVDMQHGGVLCAVGFICRYVIRNKISYLQREISEGPRAGAHTTVISRLGGEFWRQALTAYR